MQRRHDREPGLRHRALQEQPRLFLTRFLVDGLDASLDDLATAYERAG